MANAKKLRNGKEPYPDVTVVVKPNASTDEIKMETRKAFMGLAKVNFAANNDLGRGPNLTMCSINARPVNKKRRDDFIRAVGGDPLDLTKPLTALSRYDPEHAIIVLVERRFVEELSLVKNPLDVKDLNTLRHIEWKDKENFSLSKGTIANGNGRIDFCRTVLAPHLIANFARIERALANKPAINIMRTLKDDLKKAKQALEEPTSWLVALYDLDMINSSSHELQIKLALASNTPIYQVPDSEDEALDLILSNMGDLPADQRLVNLKSHSSLSLIACGPKRLAPVVNNKAMMLQVINLYRYSKLWALGGLCTNQLYDWRTAVSPFFEAIVNQGVSLLDYLTTNIDPPPDVKGNIAVIPELQPHKGVLDVEFFNIASECYVKRLYHCRDSFGVAAEFLEKEKIQYTDRYSLYVKDIVEQVGQWCKTRYESCRHDPNEAELANIYLTMPARLEYALCCGLFNDAKYGLQLPTNSPVMCKFFIIDTCDMLAKYRSVIMELFRTLDPFFCSILVDSRRDTEFKDQPTEFLCAWIKRQDPKIPALEVVNRCLSTVIRHRNTALVKMVATDLGKPPRYPDRASLYSAKFIRDTDGDAEEENTSAQVGVWTHQYHELVELMRLWRNQEADEAGVRVVTTYPSIENCPKVQAQMLKLREHGPILLHMLNSTALHWASFSPSQSTAHFRTLSGYLINSLWAYTHHGSRYLSTNEVWDLREELRVCLVHNLGSFFGFCDLVTQQIGGRKDTLTQTTLEAPRKLVLENVEKTMEGNTHAVVKVIAHQLMNKHLGAIPAGKGRLVLPNPLYKAAMVLFEEIAIASWKARSMYTDLKVNRMKDVSKKRRASLFEELPLPDAFKCASKREEKEYYMSVTKEAIADIQVAGKGSEREQVKIARALEKVKKRIDKINHSLGVRSPEEVGLEHLLAEASSLEKIEQPDDDDDGGGLIPQSGDEGLPWEEGYANEDEDEDENESGEGDEDEGDEDEDDVDKDEQGIEQEESEEGEEDGVEENVPDRKRARADSTSSEESHRPVRRRRLNSPDRREQQSTQQSMAIVTPDGQDMVAEHPPDAPKGCRIGKVDEQAPASTFPNAQQAPARDSSPEYIIDDGLDDRTLIEMASFADNMVIAPTQLFKDAKKGADVAWTSSPQAGPSSPTPPAVTRVRDLRLRQQRK